jgi:serine/threonine protein phosphatase 1
VIQRIFERLFASRQTPPPAERERLSSDTWPAVVYAIGDVHGCLDQLRTMTNMIVEDARDIAGEKWIVMLGDYVDRGPDSAGVLDFLTASPPAGFRRICLAGNHESLLLDFMANPDPDADWLRWGGFETLGSYGISGITFADLPRSTRINVLTGHIPREHIDFLEGLPIALRLPGVTFVHAGLRPGVTFDDQRSDDLIWIREPFLSHDIQSSDRVVHGHTPTDEPVVTPARIGIDTCAFAGGPLTAVRLRPDGEPFFLSAPGSRK